MKVLVWAASAVRAFYSRRRQQNAKCGSHVCSVWEEEEEDVSPSSRKAGQGRRRLRGNGQMRTHNAGSHVVECFSGVFVSKM